MLRLLPLLALALVPAAVAAPVPPQAELPSFGPDGLLTEADLDKVVFDSQPVPKDEVERVKRLERARPERIELKPRRPRAKNEFDVAVHIPLASFREGGPAPAYFVLRNNRGHELELHSRLDLVGREPLPRGDGRLYDIRDRKTGQSVLLARLAQLTDGHLVEVPPDGFYCQKVDLNHLAGESLPPGEYEVDWRCGPWRAKPVPFTVIARDDGPKPEPPARPMLRFFHLTEDPVGEERAQKAVEWDEPRVIAWTGSELVPHEANDMAAALAVGQSGVYVPDVYQIPARDKLVAVEAVFKPYRDGDRIAVTLRAVLPHKSIEFDEPPHLYLQLETPMPGETRAEARLQRKARALAAVPILKTPLTIEARLPDGWRESCGASGPARVSVLVVSKELDIPEFGLQKAKADEVRQLRAEDDPPRWQGVLRTGSAPVHLPTPLPFDPWR